MCQTYSMDIDATAFWKRVNKLIKEKETKQKAIADKCNISYQTFRGWVTRKTFPAGDETFLIAKALGTTVEYLVTGKEPESQLYLEALKSIQGIVKKTLA